MCQGLGVVFFKLAEYTTGMHPLLALNLQTYNQIASKFAQTRQKPLWPEIYDFKKYIKPGQKVLDFGCGSGRLLNLFSASSADKPVCRRGRKDIHINYTGVDNSPKLLKIAKSKAKTDRVEECSFAVSDILSDTLKSRLKQRNFDVVFCLAVLHHIPAQELRLKALSQIYGLLKDNGYLFMTNWNLWRLSFKDKTWWRYKIKVKSEKSKVKSTSQKSNVPMRWKDVITYWQDGGESYPLYYHAFTLRELGSLLKKAGFKVVKNQYSLNNHQAHWWNGSNIVTIARKT